MKTGEAVTKDVYFLFLVTLQLLLKYKELVWLIFQYTFEMFFTCSFSSSGLYIEAVGMRGKCQLVLKADTFTLWHSSTFPPSPSLIIRSGSKEIQDNFKEKKKLKLWDFLGFI